jgi:hypothetical protein
MKILYIEKREYKIPSIEQIMLDNKISLVMESTPPAGPYELSNNAPEFFRNNPFKTNVG